MDLVEILKNTPKGTKLYSTIHGEVIFDHIEKDHSYPIRVTIEPNGVEFSFTKEGLRNAMYNGECVLFPSKINKDWNKFKVEKKKYKVGDYLLRKSTNSVYKIIAVYPSNKYDLKCITTDSGYYLHYTYIETKTLDADFEPCNKFPLNSLKEFDRVLVRDSKYCPWKCAFFSHICEDGKYASASGTSWGMCVPYNDDTKLLVGTKFDASEFYKLY